MKARILLGDCREQMRKLADASVDAIVTDPPYGLGFMGKEWDRGVPGVDVWTEALRVLKPGGHMVAFFGSRTYHRGAVAIEDAGFEVRDQLMWIYGSGFPKSQNLAIALDKRAGAMEHRGRKMSIAGDNCAEGVDRPYASGIAAHEPITDDAKRWNGWGTALKPAHEPIVLARKPLVGTVAANVLEHGTGAINVDGCRVGDEVLPAQVRGVTCMGTFQGADGNETPERIGRWPANVMHDGSDEATEHFGDAARFFYSAKADADDRNEGLPSRMRNRHPTVKPVDLMRWLVRLITPPGGVVLDPFMGSGSTGKACALEGFDFIGCELDAAHVDVAEVRIAHAGGLFVQVEVER